MRYIATYLIYIAVLSRAIGWNQETSPIPLAIWILLALYGGVLFSERWLTRRMPLYPRVYTLVQSTLVIAMIYNDPTIDFLNMLFYPLSFQAVLFFNDPVGFACIGVFSVAMLGMLLAGLEWEAGLTMVLAGSGANFLMGSFAHLIKRTEKRRADNQELLGNLQEAYRQLKDSAVQAEALAATAERHRLVRELHDSLTQTLFSMNLAVQSAQISLGDDSLHPEEYIDRLQNLARNAASEVQTLTGQNPLGSLVHEGLLPALRQLADQRIAQDGLQVLLESTGQRVLSESVNVNLYRIAQEALNNITRHAGVRKALVRLNLEGSHASLEIIDEGCGFNQLERIAGNGFGLTGMAERAAEIGWCLEIKSSPGFGTHILVTEKA